MQIDLKELRAKAEAATPGPWRGENRFDIRSLARGTFVASCLLPDPVPDVEFIAAVNPAVVLELLRRLETKDEVREILEDELLKVRRRLDVAGAGLKKAQKALREGSTNGVFWRERADEEIDADLREMERK